jgi:putative ABC transport system substrate-binding protein
VIDRRTFISSVTLGLLAAPLAAEGQSTGRVVTVGYLSPGVGRSHIEEAFEQSLQQLGWVKDQSIRIEYRYSGGRQDTVAPLTADVVGSGVDVLVAWGPPLSLAAKRATSQIPLVFLLTFDPVDVGLVSNYARPGGNVTGITNIAGLEIFAKRLQLLKEAVPSLTRVAVLTSMEQTRSRGGKEALTAAAKTLSLELHDIAVEAPSALEAAIRRAKDQGAQAIYVWPSGFTFAFGKQIADLAQANRLPSFHPFREGALAGGLAAYAADLKDVARHGAVYVDKILRGTQPGKLPIEQLSQYELIINLKTAKALGLTIPPSLLQRADQVIE